MRNHIGSRSIACADVAKATNKEVKAKRSGDLVVCVTDLSIANL
jgi:hypothetical protein